MGSKPCIPKAHATFQANGRDLEGQIFERSFYGFGHPSSTPCD